MQPEHISSSSFEGYMYVFFVCHFQNINEVLEKKVRQKVCASQDWWKLKEILGCRILNLM